MSEEIEQNSKLCLECQACCRFMTFYTDYKGENSKDKIKFLETWGCKVVKDDNDHVCILVPFPCQHIKFDGCDCYKERPQVCKDWDGNSDPVMSNFCLWEKKNEST